MDELKLVGIWVCVILMILAVFGAVAYQITDGAIFAKELTYEDGKYKLILPEYTMTDGLKIQPDGTYAMCVPPLDEWDHAYPQTNNSYYTNGTEITRLERIGDTANFTINDNMTLVYWDIVPHVIYKDESQRYAIEYINTTTCDRNVMIGDRECITTTSQKYHIFIHQEAYDDFKYASEFMRHEDTIYIGAGGWSAGWAVV